jgi:hypothetical protein
VIDPGFTAPLETLEPAPVGTEAAISPQSSLFQHL